MRSGCGIILGGGRGERFGVPKAFAMLPDGRTFLGACRDVLAAAGCEPVVATLPHGASPPSLEPVRAVVLPRPDLAMFDSLQLALAAALNDDRWQVAVILPVDHPLVAPATVRALLAGHTRAAVPRYRGKRGHPVALERTIATMVALGKHPGPTLRDVLHAAGIDDVEVDDPGVGANCNTPDALAAAWERVRSRPAAD